MSFKHDNLKAIRQEITYDCKHLFPLHLLYINLSWYLWKQGELRFHFSSWQVFNCCALSKSSALQKLVAGESADSLKNLEVFPNLPQFWFCFQFPFCCSNFGFPYAHFFVVYMRNHSEKHSFHDLKKKFLEKVNKLIYGLPLINLIPTFFSELRFKCRGWLTWGKISLKEHFEFVPWTYISVIKKFDTAELIHKVRF